MRYPVIPNVFPLTRRMAGAFAAGLLLAASGAAYAADPGNGGKIYATHCSSCHGDDGVSTMPGTPDFARRERMFKPDTALLVSIRDGISVMPAYKGLLTDQEILDVIAYLRTFR
ncbi:MAG: c-type cytochrome [Pseudomonadota bacterium]